MDYSTEFEGKLLFKKELVASQLAYLQTILGEDCREYPEWNEPDLSYIDLKLTPDFDGILWSDDDRLYVDYYPEDKTVECVNLVIRLMRERWPDFGLEGRLVAKGEDVDDRWNLVIGKDGFAKKVDVPLPGEPIECPHCGGRFIPGGDDGAENL